MQACNFQVKIIVAACREGMQRGGSEWEQKRFARSWAEIEFKITIKNVFNVMDLQLIGSFAGVKGSPVNAEHFSFLIQAGKVLEPSSVIFCH